MTELYTPWMFSPYTEFMIYFWLMGIVHAVVVISGLVVATPTLFIYPKRYLIFARGYCVFNLILVIVCAFLNLLWSYTVWGVVYFSMDYVTDFSPFWPITQHLIDYEFGGKTGRILNGLTIYHVQAIWFLFAFAAWMITIYLYSRIRKIWNRRSSDQASNATSESAPGADSLAHKADVETVEKLKCGFKEGPVPRK